ncbi:MAG: hypothetical protein ACHQ2F_13290 [Desulfobaccales bacterium]
MIFSGIGALFYWGARALAMDDFYREACLFLVLALICACLGVGAP